MLMIKDILAYVQNPPNMDIAAGNDSLSEQPYN